MTIKKHLCWFSLFLFIAISACKYETDQVATKAPPSDWFFQQRAFPNKDLNPKYLQYAMVQKKEMAKLKTSPVAFNKDWIFIGPNNVGGRITDIEMWPDDLNTILAGSASGGIFKSEDQGTNWSPIFDDASSLSIGDIDISKSNPDHIYVGTGESNAGGGSIAYDGTGVYKSTDRGEQWESVGLEKVGSIGKVIIHPDNENIIFVAAMGRLFSSNDERGVYRSENGGESWQQVLFVSDSTGAIDLAIDPEEPEIIFAAMWERTRKVNNLKYGGKESGIWKSIDGGDNWFKLENGLPTAGSEKGRIALAIAPSESKTIYAHFADQEGYSQGFYVSYNSGNSWEERSTLGIDNVSYQWWFSKLFVHPKKPEVIFYASLNMQRSIDGGQSWNRSFNGAHVDHHALYIHPIDPEFIINGNDGGINISNNGGRDNIKSGNLANIQFYACEIDPNNTDRILGGSQDNGTWGNVGDNPNTWTLFQGGDGFNIAFEPGNESIFYVEIQNGVLFKTIDNGFSFRRIGGEILGRKNWNTPITLDQLDPAILYSGSQNIWRSTDRGDSWDSISPDLSNGPYPGNRQFGTITTIEVSSLNNKIIYAGTDDGNVWNTSDGGLHWNKINPPMINRWTTSVLPSPDEELTAYVTFSGFRFGTNDGHIYKTSDLGNTWVDITGDLPDVPVNNIQKDLNGQGTLFVATDIGVFYSINEGQQWNMLGQGLPNVPIMDLDIEIDGKLAAATYGRSMYYYQIDEISSLQNQTIDISIYPNPVIDDLHFNVDENIDHVLIYTLDGRLISEHGIDQQKSIKISALPNGVYVAQFWSGTKSSGYQFIKTN